MKKILAIVLTFIMMLAVVACGGDKKDTTEPADEKEEVAEEAADSDEDFEKDSTEKKEEGEQLTIGYACKDINDTFQNYLIDAAQEYCDANNIKLEVTDAQNDVIKQQDQVNNFIMKGVDAIIVLPIDSSAMQPITDAAKEADVPLVYCNTAPYPADQFPEGTYYVGSIEREAGEMQAEYIGAQLKENAKVCILQGSLGHEGALERTAGVEEKLKELYPTIEVIAVQPADWQKDEALTVTENWLTTFDNDVDAIFANNDEMALGAVNALKAAGIEDCLVAGIDGTKDGIAAIKDGGLACSVFQDAAGQGAGACELAAKIVREGGVEEDIVWVPFQLIKPDNVDDFNQ